MFDGDIICRSKPGHGSNFVFIVALGNGSNNNDNGSGNLSSGGRIMNPIQRQYQKFGFSSLAEIDENDSEYS